MTRTEIQAPALDVGRRVDEAQAIKVFLQQVWPQVRAVHPCVSTPRFVDDLAAVHRDASVVIAPQLSGGGVKVLEAMGHGLPCLVSGLVADAYADSFAVGQEFLIARAAQVLADYILAALRQASTLHAKGDRMRALFLRTFSSPVAWLPVQRTAGYFSRASTSGS